MSKKIKALQRLRQNPKHVRFSKIENILLGLGFVKRQEGSSHAIFKNGSHVLTISHHQSFIYKATVLDVLRVLEDMDEVGLED